MVTGVFCQSETGFYIGMFFFFASGVLFKMVSSGSKDNGEGVAMCSFSLVRFGC